MFPLRPGLRRLWLAIGVIAFDLPAAAAAQPKVLILGIDGCRPDALAAADTPHLDSLRDSGAWSLTGVSTRVPISGPAWTSALTGVWIEKHGVADNSFEGARFDLFPILFCRLKEARPDALVASIIRWPPLATELIRCADISLSPANDATAADEAIAILETADPDLVFLHLNAPDAAGHAFEFSPQSRGYLDSIESVDSNTGRVLDAVRRRPRFADEDWLVIATTDHGGAAQDHHDDIPENRTIFLFASGPRVEPGALRADPGITDVAPIALAYLGLEIDPAWSLDGVPIALVEAPRAGFQVAGDCDQDGSLAISDVHCLLGELFGGVPAPLPCGPATPAALLDGNGDGFLDLSDAVHLLLHLFAGGEPPALGSGCVPIEDCASACTGD